MQFLARGTTPSSQNKAEGPSRSLQNPQDSDKPGEKGALREMASLYTQGCC